MVGKYSAIKKASLVFFLMLKSFNLFAEKNVYNLDDGRPTYKPHLNDYPGSVSPFISTAPKSLPSQKLARSSYPDEAEIFCGTGQCIFGFSRGLVVGGDVFAMLFAPMRRSLDPNWVSGDLTIIDVFGGFEILKDVNASNYMNAQVGYRRLNFDDGTNKIANQGMTVGVNYSQLITSFYNQNLEFSGFFVFGSAELNNSRFLRTNDVSHNKLNSSAGYFYRISQNYPTYRIALPADIEVINWNKEQTGLPMPVHGYLELNPFYIQNNLNFSDNNISLQKKEQNFGIRFAGIASYESSVAQGKSGRYALKSELGLEFSTSNFTTTSSGGADLDLPKRSFINPYIEVAGSWQF